MGPCDVTRMEELLAAADAKGAPDKETARKFLCALFGAVDREISARASNVTEIPIPASKIESEPVLTLGLIPKQRLVDLISAGTKFTPKSIEALFDKLDNKLVRAELQKAVKNRQPLYVEGLGVFEPTAEGVVFHPEAFQYLCKICAD